MDKNQLLDYCYEHRDDYIRDFDSINEGIRAFDCLILLVEEGDVADMESLARYGMEF